MVIVVTILIYIQYQKYLDSRDKQRFETVKEDIEVLTERLNKVDSNIEWEVSADCRRAHHVWGDGRAGCQVDTTAESSLDSDGQVRELIGKYTKTFEEANDLFRKDGEYSASDYSPDFPKDLKPGSSGQPYWSDRGDMVCGSLFEIEDTYGDPPSDELKMIFACNDVARDTWFPRSDM